MPELPEVETIRRQLSTAITGSRVVDVWALDRPKFRSATQLLGHRIEAPNRRGKFLIFPCSQGLELIIHLGMTGQLQVGDLPKSVHEDPYLRAQWTLEHAVLSFRDVRQFGRIRVVEAGNYEGTLAHLGPEPFWDAFTPELLRNAIVRSRRPIKTQLLSQRIVAGVGNIYADEALWQAQIHPCRHRLSHSSAERLRDAIRDVLQQGIDLGGTTLRDYRGADGSTGTNQHHLRCYGRSGLPCLRCGDPLRRLLVDARSTTYCVTCQH